MRRKRPRVSADESLSAISADLDKFTRMFGTCLSSVSRVNFASLSRLSLFLGLIIDASISRKCDVGALNGTLVGPPRALGDGTDPLSRKAENRRTKGDLWRDE